jgi:tRNA threonylcarbamoyladenosine biosynthesis protein TsaE
MAALVLDLHRELADAEATRAAGVALGRALRGGDVVALIGELGAGKTTLVVGVVDGAGGDVGAVASPTFALVNQYGGRLPIAHVDLYRLERERELDELGLDELWGAPPFAALVEWADRFADRLPPDHLAVTLAHAGLGRVLHAEPRGPASTRLLEAWRAALA